MNNFTDKTNNWSRLVSSHLVCDLNLLFILFVYSSVSSNRTINRNVIFDLFPIKHKHCFVSHSTAPHYYENENNTTISRQHKPILMSFERHKTIVDDKLTMTEIFTLQHDFVIAHAVDKAGQFNIVLGFWTVLSI